MSMTILKMCKDVAYKLGVTPPTSLFGSTEPISLRFVTLLEDQGRYLRNQKVFPQQKKLHTVTTSAARVKYPLPADFYAAVPGTNYDTSRKARMSGPTSDANFNEALYGAGTSGFTKWRIYGPDANPASSGGQFYIDPPPAGVQTFTFDYITKYLFYDSTYATGSETIAADTDVSLFDDDIMLKGLEWRYRESKGQNYQDQKAEHDKLVEAAAARYMATYKGSFMGHPEGPLYTIADGSWPI